MKQQDSNRTQNTLLSHKLLQHMWQPALQYTTQLMLGCWHLSMQRHHEPPPLEQSNLSTVSSRPRTCTDHYQHELFQAIPHLTNCLIQLLLEQGNMSPCLHVTCVSYQLLARGNINHLSNPAQVPSRALSKGQPFHIPHTASCSFCCNRVTCPP